MFLNIPNFAFNFKQQQEHGEMTKIGNRISIPYAAISHYKTLSIYGNDDLSVTAASNTIRSQSGANYTDLPISTSLPIFGLKCSVNAYNLNPATIRSLNSDLNWVDDYTARAYGLTFTINPQTNTITISGTRTESSTIFYDLSRTALPSPVGKWGEGTFTTYVYDPTLTDPVGFGYNSSNYALSYGVYGSTGQTINVTLSPMIISATESAYFTGEFSKYTGAYPSNSNFTDDVGQKWVCDSVDFNYENTTGVYTNRINYDATSQSLSVLATPTTGNMSAAEIAAFNALQLYPNNTILSNTNNNTMKITYTA